MDRKVIHLAEAKRMADSAYRFFRANYEQLCEQYPNKYVVINENGIDGIYDTFEQAHQETILKCAEGSFFIYLCASGDIARFQNGNVNFVR